MVWVLSEATLWQSFYIAVAAGVVAAAIVGGYRVARERVRTRLLSAEERGALIELNKPEAVCMIHDNRTKVNVRGRQLGGQEAADLVRVVHGLYERRLVRIDFHDNGIEECTLSDEGRWVVRRLELKR